MNWRRGDRVALVRTDDPDTRLRPGDQGTVIRWDPAQGQLHIRWDSGSTLTMLPGAGDQVRTLTAGDPEPLAARPRLAAEAARPAKPGQAASRNLQGPERQVKPLNAPVPRREKKENRRRLKPCQFRLVTDVRRLGEVRIGTPGHWPTRRDEDEQPGRAVFYYGYWPFRRGELTAVRGNRENILQAA